MRVGWYVPRALGEPGTSPRKKRAQRHPALAAGVAAACSILLLGACGEKERQDENEVAGEFSVEVSQAKFPPRQRLAETVDLSLEVTNTGGESVPDLAITIYTGDAETKADGSFNIRSDQAGLADPNRPVWILENDYPKILEDGVNPSKLDDQPTAGAETAATDTYSFGALGPNESKTIFWRVTPVTSGTYTVHYELAGGLDGKAKIVTADGSPVEGEFVPTITDKPPQTRVTDGGRVEVAR